VTLATNSSSDLTIDFGYEPAVLCAPGTFVFTGNSGLSGAAGNVRTFTVNGVKVNATAFSRTTSGTWGAAFLGAWDQGLGVTDSSEGDGAGNTHKVDNRGRLNYVMFEFSTPVVVNKALLNAIAGDSDISVWIGTKADPFNNHLTLSDSVLTSLGSTEANDTASTTSSRWADINSASRAGNVLVIAASVSDDTPDDEFKINKLEVQCK
jgi:hypothetical protein